MTALPTPDQRRRTVLLLEAEERAILDVLAVLPAVDFRRHSTEERLKKCRTRLAIHRDGVVCQ